jgi:hypothetical protein
MLTLNFKSYCKTVCYEDQLVFYIVTFVYWNILYIESCIYKSVLGKLNKLQKKIHEWRLFQKRVVSTKLDIYVVLVLS